MNWKTRPQEEQTSFQSLQDHNTQGEIGDCDEEMRS